MPPAPATLVAFLSQSWRPFFGAIMPAANQAPGVGRSAGGRIRGSHGAHQQHGTIVHVVTAGQRRRSTGRVGERAAHHEVAVLIEIDRRELKAFGSTAPATAGGTGTLRQNSEMMTWRGPARVPMPSAPNSSTPVPRPRISPVFLTVALKEVIPQGAPPGFTPATTLSTGAPACAAERLHADAAVELEENVVVPVPVAERGPRRDQPRDRQKSLDFH